jgi:hypothetical protein
MEEIRGYVRKVVESILAASGFSDGAATASTATKVTKPTKVAKATAATEAVGANATTAADEAAVAVGTARGVGNCPKCGQPVVETPVSYRCQAGKACGFALWKTILGKDIDLSTAKRLLSGQKTRYLSGFRSKAGKPFTAALSLTRDGKLDFHFRSPGQKGGGRRRRSELDKAKTKD